jgi:hypothetical protein
VRGDTIRWRGVLAEDDGKSGLTIADLRAFLADADALAGLLGTCAGDAVPLVAVHRDGAIRHIWVGVARRRWRPGVGPHNVAAGTIR